MASLGGSVDFSRMKQQLRQLFHHPNSVTKEDVFSVAEEQPVPQDEDLSYEAWVAYRKKQKQPAGTGAAPRPSSKNGNGKKPKAPKGGQEKMVLTGALGNVIVVMVVEVNTIFCPSVPQKWGKRCQLRRLLHLRLRVRPFLPLRWRIPRKMSIRYNILFPPP